MRHHSPGNGTGLDTGAIPTKEPEDELGTVAPEATVGPIRYHSRQELPEGANQPATVERGKRAIPPVTGLRY